MRNIVLLFFVGAFCLRSLDAGVETYFKPALDKPAPNGIMNIDFIYVINLDQRPEKIERTKNSLAPYGIVPYRFSAVNGWQLPNKAFDELGVIYEAGMPHGPICSVYRHEPDGTEHMSYEIMKEVGVAYYCHSLSRGAIGCLMSHLSIMQDAYDSGYETVWIMEDDVKIVRDPNELSFILNGLNRQAPDWDILFTDNEIKGADGKPIPCAVIRPRPLLQVQPLEYYLRRTSMNSDVTKIGMRFGSASMIIHRSGMKKVLDFFKTYKIYFPYDIDYFLVPGINLYACNQDIVTNISGGDSDNGAPNYNKNN
jgi:GR25 family glycosyltransferase involved in LPS biosynthesis